MKKTFYQLHPLFLLLVCFMVAFVGSGVYMLVAGIYYKIYWTFLVSIPFTLLMGYYCIYAVVYHHVRFDETGIHVLTDKLEKNAKIQYETHVSYEDIVKVEIVRSIKNSKRKFIESMAISSNSLKTYLKFTLKSGEVEWIFIMYFSRKQREEMFDIINQKTNLNLDYQTLISNVTLG